MRTGDSQRGAERCAENQFSTRSTVTILTARVVAYRARPLLKPDIPAMASFAPPKSGQPITMGADNKLNVPDHPIIPFIEGDGTGRDIWRASVRVLDAAVAKAYGGKKKISWYEVYAGEKAYNQFNNWLPDETIEAFEKYLVGIKGPLTTPIGGGIRSLNVALRQMLDLYVCLRPVRWFKGVPSPVKHPEHVDMVIFRENTEDIYAGIEWPGGTAEAKKILDFLAKEFPKDFTKIRFGKEAEPMVGIGIKAGQQARHRAAVRSAIEYAIAHKRKSVTIVHKGNIMKYTEGAFRDWGYASRRRVRRGRVRRRPVVQDSKSPASSSRTRSPTSRSSRCSRARRSSTSSRRST